METATAPSDRLGELLARDKVRQESGAGRPKKGPCRPNHKDTKINPENVSFQSRDNSQARTRTGDDEGGEDNDAFTIEVVRKVPRWEREQDHRSHLRQPDQA